MTAYLVRTKDDKELVGIFVCELGGLAWLVDECNDVDLCEYKELGPGGFYWGKPGAQKVPLLNAFDPFDETTTEAEAEQEPESLNFEGVSLSEEWVDKFYRDPKKPEDFGTWTDIPQDARAQVSVDLRKRMKR